MKFALGLLAVGAAVGALYWLRAHDVQRLELPTTPADPAQSHRTHAAELRRRHAGHFTWNSLLGRPVYVGGLGQPVT